MGKIAKIFTVSVLGGFLVLIRGFEDLLFYDPLLAFFKSVQSYDSLPRFDTLKLILNVALRFLLNTLISLSILWVIFQNRDIVRLSLLLYTVLFIVLFCAFCYLLLSGITSEKGNYLSLFYVRRFLIQPIFLLVLIPAFYFQKKK
jgi:exosortase F-associated protein